jgi:hypothetical protein
MIDLRFLAAHALWILGTAIVLAGFSYYGWRAGGRHESRWTALRTARGWHATFWAGLWFAAAGFLLMASTPWWARIGWAVVWAASAAEVWRSRRTDPED